MCHRQQYTPWLLKVCWSHHDAAAAAADDGGDGDDRPHHSGHKGDTAAIGDDVDDVVDSNAGGGVDADVGADADTDADSCVWADAMPVPIVVPMRMPAVDADGHGTYDADDTCTDDNDD